MDSSCISAGAMCLLLVMGHLYSPKQPSVHDCKQYLETNAYTRYVAVQG